jgi:hypothetical protein
VIPKEYNDYVSAYTTCDAVFLYEAALKKTLGASETAVVQKAIESLGTGYKSASVLGASTGFGSGDHDAPASYRPWGWQSGCSCFAYTGGPRAMP